NQLFSKILVPLDGLEYPFRSEQKTALINLVNKFNFKTIVIDFNLFVLYKGSIFTSFCYI
ncbi:MAG: hypothetical protein QOK72_10490, partial [Nitrososphaeraceae archaeon]|nr:hypothetical protein [Nitrososphaeraceae archaeon]